MKKNLIKRLAIVITLSLITPSIIQPSNMTVVEAAAKPALSKTKLTLTGLKEIETLVVNNKVKGATYFWSSTNTKVATVNYQGEITPVSKGSTVIKVRIKYPNSNKNLVLSCTVKVIIPATKIVINNAKIGDNNAHVIYVGESYDFNGKLTPSNSSYYSYYRIDEKDIDKNIATVSNKGILTAQKKGIIRLNLIAAPSRAAIPTSEVRDHINISIIERPVKTAQVTSINLASAQELVIKFSNPIDASTILNASTKELNNSIRIHTVLNQDKDTIDPGKLTGTLSEDLKTLTIKATNIFSGTYEVGVTKNVRTTEQVPVVPDIQIITLKDNIGPYYTGTLLDDSGLASIINFSEPIDISNLEIVSIGNVAQNSQTESILSNESNYKLSLDKKSLKIDLNQLLTTERNKAFTVTLNGIKDLGGNQSDPPFIPVSLYTDTTPKPQAKILSIQRTEYNTVSVKYDRAIRSPGYAVIGGNTTYGQIDLYDNKTVNYTLYSQQSALRGNQVISIGHWDSYNVMVTDTSAQKYTNATVNFDVDNSAPYIVNYVLEPVTVGTITNYNLILTYNERVTLNSISGVLASTIYASNGDIIPNKSLYYTATVNDNVVTITFAGTQITALGNYNVKIPANIVKDAFFNFSIAKDITINQNGSSGNELPAPTKVEQSTTNLNEILLTFANKLDKTSAETLANYSIYGANVIKAQLTEQTDNKAVVTLTLEAGTIAYNNASYTISLTGIEGYNNSYSAIKKYEVMIPLKENKAPIAIQAKLSPSKYMVEVTFSENIQGNPNFNVYQNNILLTSTTPSITISNNTMYIALTNTPYGTGSITVVPTANNYITDMNGNMAIVPTLYAY